MNNGERREERRTAAPALDFRPGRGNMTSRAMVQKPKDMKKTIGRLLRYLGRSRYVLLSLLVIMLLVTAADLCGPLLQGKAIDAIEPVYRNAATGEILFDYDKNDPVWGDIAKRTAHLAGGARSQ